MARTDLQLTNNDIDVLNNDFIISESDGQHVQDTINANVGWWKETYTSGVGVMSYLKSKNTAELSRKIMIELKADNYNSSPIMTFTNNGLLNINPNVTL